MPRRWFLVPLATTAGSAALVSQPPAPRPAAEEQIVGWVRQLGDPDFAVREAATRKLMRHPKAFPAVREASRSSDAEVARRAADILKVYGRLEAERSLPKIKAHVRDWEPDLFVERVLRYGGNEDHVWLATIDFGYASYELLVQRERALIKNPRRRGGIPAGLPEKDLVLERRGGTTHTLSPDTRMVTDRGWYFFRGRSLAVGTLPALRLAVVEDSLRAVGLVNFAFVNGPVSIVTGPPAPWPLNIRGESKSVLSGVMVCDGDIDFPDLGKADYEGIGGVVVSNGTVRCPKYISGMILATGDVYIPEGAKIQYALIRAGGKIHAPKKYDVSDSELIENAPDPTAPFKFFELSRVGLAVKAADGGVRVEKAEEKKPFAAAGLRKGDVVTAVDGKKAESVAGFRKQIRFAFVQGDCTLNIRRGAESKELTVRFSD
jgi:hypothetical protein